MSKPTGKLIRVTPEGIGAVPTSSVVQSTGSSTTNVMSQKAVTDAFQPKGSYQAAGYSYSKAESDTKYQPKGSYAPAGNYALKGESYTKAEGDARYQLKGGYKLRLIFTFTTDADQTVTLPESITGKLICFSKISNGIEEFSDCVISPLDTCLLSPHFHGDSSAHIQMSNGGKTMKIYNQRWFQPKKLYVVE